MKEFEDIQRCMNNTWECIGMDVLEASGVDYVPKCVVIEMVLDANRLDEYGHCEEEELKEFNALSITDKIKIAEKAFKFENYGY